MHVRAWQATYAAQVGAERLAGLDPAHAEQLWAQRLREPEPGHRVQVAVRDGDVVGFVTTVASVPPDEDGELLALNVHPEHWGAGVGGALLAAAVGDLAARGCAQAHLWVAEGNERARTFYARHGWALGTSPDDVGSSAIRGVPVPTVRYRRPLGETSR